MHILLAAHSKNRSVAQPLNRRFAASQRYASEVLSKPIEDFTNCNLGRTLAFTSAAKTRTWKVPSWIDDADGILAFSMPPAPMTDLLHIPWEDYVREHLLHKFQPERFAPNYFGVRITHGRLDVWTDHLGMGRCYLVETEDWLAVSNHIGCLTHFLETEPEVDETALAKFSAFGWYTESSSPVRGVTRIGAAQHIEVSEAGTEYRTYLSLADVYSGVGESAQYESAATQMMAVNSNLGRMSASTPTVYLSGGRDSRMTCGTWIGGGADARVVTYGDLEQEAAIATSLMDIFQSTRTDPSSDQDVTHDIIARTGSNVDMPLATRISRSFELWDGDAVPVKLRGNIRASEPKAFSVSGIGGEITHGYFYSKPGMLERISTMETPMSRLEEIYCRPVHITDYTHKKLNGFFSRKEEDYRQLGLSDFRLLDYFYVEEKLRRWSPQGMSTSSPVPLCTLEYQRLAFRISLDEQLAVEAPRRISNLAVPGWGDVPTYKANPEDTRRVAKTAPRVWSTDPEEFGEHVATGRRWEQYVKRETVAEACRRTFSGEMSEMYESWLLRAVWINATYEHIASLARRWRDTTG